MQFPQGFSMRNTYGKLPLTTQPVLENLHGPPSQQYEGLPTDSSPKSTMSMPIPGDDPERDAETMAPTLIGMSIAFVAMSTTVVVLRLYTRYCVVCSPGPDDLTIAMAQVLSIGVSIATILQAKFDLGRHVWMVSPENSTKQLKCLFAAMVVYNLAQILTKTSFLFQYRRIFQVEERNTTRKICLYLLIFLAIWGITQEILVGFACNPVSLFIPSQAERCIDSLIVWYLTSAMNIITDFIIFLVPLPAIRSLQLPRRQKILVTSVFCLGFFTCVISIVRLFTLHGAIKTTDPTWDNVPSAYWSVVELNCGILCASLPPLRPLLRRLGILGSLDGPSGGNNGEEYYGDGSKRLSRIMGSGTGNKKGMEGVYRLDDLETASQERLHESRDSIEDRVPGAVDSYYHWSSPGYATRNSGGLANSILTSEVKGGKQHSPEETEDDVEVDGQATKLAVKVTREIDTRSEKKLPTLPVQLKTRT